MIDMKRSVCPAGPEGRIILDACKNDEYGYERIDFTMIEVRTRMTISMYVENVDELIEKLQALRAWQKEEKK